MNLISNNPIKISVDGNTQVRISDRNLAQRIRRAIALIMLMHKGHMLDKANFLRVLLDAGCAEIERRAKGAGIALDSAQVADATARYSVLEEAKHGKIRRVTRR